MEVITSYEPHSEDPEYIEANNAFIQTLNLESIQHVIDLACGTGTMSMLLLQRKPDLKVIGLDILAESLEIAKTKFQAKQQLSTLENPTDPAQVNPGTMSFVLGSADELPFKDACADLVMMGNSIHLLPDRDKLLAEINRVLKPGGTFIFNSVFYAGTFPEGTERFYTEWMKTAVEVLETKNQTRVAQGLDPYKRKRGTAKKAFSLRWLSPDQWTELLATHSLKITQQYQRTVMMTQSSFETIAAFAGFAETLMSGYPVEISSECLQAAVGQTFQAMDLETVPRLWLEVVAIKST